MNTKEKTEALESQKIECAKIMRKSDEHLFGCLKRGEVFSEKYPEEYRDYVDANKRYNELEEELSKLYSDLRKEEELNEMPEFQSQPEEGEAR